MTLPSIADRPRYYQCSTVKTLTTLPFKFVTNASGVIQAGPGMPPQTFVTANTSTTFDLQVPNGNPAKCWVYATASNGVSVSVSGYATVATTGILVLTLSAVPASSTIIQGVISWGQVADDPAGAVQAARTGSDIYPANAHGQFKSTSPLENLMIIPIEFTYNGSSLDLTYGPLGTTITDTGTGEYDIDLDFQEPHNAATNWSMTGGSSDGEDVVVTIDTSTESSFILHASRASDLTTGQTVSMLLVGSPKGSDPNYGATNVGGVHSNLQVRDIHLYSQTCQYTPIRGASFYPLWVTMGATTTGPDASVSNIPTNLLIERTGVGVYVIYVGSFKKATGAFTASDNTIVGITATDPDAGTITVTAGAELASDILSGWLSVSYQQED